MLYEVRAPSVEIDCVIILFFYMHNYGDTANPRA